MIEQIKIYINCTGYVGEISKLEVLVSSKEINAYIYLVLQ